MYILLQEIINDVFMMIGNIIGFQNRMKYEFHGVVVWSTGHVSLYHQFEI